MKDWIKENIKNSSICYLSYYSIEGDLKIQPLVYVYEKGSLVFSISILFHQKILALQINPKVCIHIPNKNGNVTVLGHVDVNEKNLDDNWLSHKIKLFDTFPEFKELEDSAINFPHLWKRSMIKIRPETIIAEEISGSSYRYDMEIVS